MTTIRLRNARSAGPVAGTVDATPRAVTTNGSTNASGSVYLTADLRSLAAGRIALALVLLRDLVGRCAASCGIWYTNDGIIPNHTLLWRPAWDHVFSLFYLASYTHEAVAGFVICAVAYACAAGRVSHQLAQVGSLDLPHQPPRTDAAVRQRRRRGAGAAAHLDDVPADGRPLLGRRGAGPRARRAHAPDPSPGDRPSRERGKTFVSWRARGDLRSSPSSISSTPSTSRGTLARGERGPLRRFTSIGWRRRWRSGCGT